MPQGFTFTFGGVPVAARPGDSIAAALEAAGIRALGTSRAGRARTHFCGMGACQDCVVAVDGALSRRACLTTARPGMVVVPQHDGQTMPAPVPVETTPAENLSCDCLVIGAGPAGLSAAIGAAEAGLSVTVLDERGEPGGQYFKPPSDGHRGNEARDRQHRRGDTLRARFATSGATLFAGETVWFAREMPGHGFQVRTVSGVRQRVFAAKAVLVAAGAMERPAIVPGWTLPGVMTIGAAQTLARRYGIAPGGRVLVAGNGPLGLQLAAELIDLGANVVAVVERAPFRTTALARLALADPGLARDGAAYLLKLRRAGVPLLSGWSVEALEGHDEVQIAHLAGEGRTRTIAVDSVAMGDGFQPQMELARLLGVPLGDTPQGAAPIRGDDGATAVPGVFLIGDAAGLGGAQAALAEGSLAGAAAARYLGRTAADDGSARKRLQKARRFQAALWRAYAAPALPAPSGDTLVCRCEHVTAGEIADAIIAGARDPGAVKRATRCAMGRCQGRICTGALLKILERKGAAAPPQALFAPQVPARPIPAAALVVEKPEWAGHRESSPAARPAVEPDVPLEVHTADLVVIGAGVTGMSAALFAARTGARVLVLDRGRINGEASGGNAGSLHLQLLSWDFGAKALAGGSPALLTLPLQKESIALWGELEDQLGADFEMRVTGGLMVAEDETQMAFLRDKAAAEGRHGIHTEVVGRDEIRTLVPAISERMVAGAWCPGEGKINPLAATAALARAAKAAGVTVEELTPVTALNADGEFYRVATPRGTIEARRVLVAAGGWSAHITRLLGVDVPVRGAPLQMVVTETAPPLVPCLLAHADRHLTMKQSDAGTLLIGGAWTARTGPTGQPQVLPESLEGNLWVAARTIPAVAGLSVVRSWAAMNIDIDTAPLLSALPGHPRVVVAATANGYTLGPFMGREAAAAVLSGRLRQDLGGLTLDRFG
ncbi:FAD-dependent oxidoreductase [Acuticoccus sp. MNP-M23]|uniref:FAD-dependent oxidoreductase n=1 Tax=Acuticoccus sp. MNP-M23 TaxID=3072793 RepID=UPI0028159627|nr:FAD-dependent oxidoreductase [Acuticoccus sp. MNP-M23]WMS42923.1 FAD-dependent oxidoreductase [Acuticoccus sp. MNP-M23]